MENVDEIKKDLGEHPRWLRHHSHWNESLGRLDDSLRPDLDQLDAQPSHKEGDTDALDS